jgi:hypothetical protein
MADVSKQAGKDIPRPPAEDISSRRVKDISSPPVKDISSPPLEDMEPMEGGDQDIDTAGTDADDSKGSLDQRVADAADEAGSAFLPQDKVLTDPKQRATDGVAKHDGGGKYERQKTGHR